MPHTITSPAKAALLFFVFFFLTLVKGYGQQFYIAPYGLPLQRVNLTPNGPVSVSVGGCGGTYDFFSIAILGNKLYYSNGSAMFVGDIIGGNSPVIANCTFLGAGNFGNALTVDKKGILYYATGNLLYSFNPANGITVFIGTMPYTAQGDLMFYNNELYMAAGEGIAKINIANVALSTLYIPIPNETIYSLTAASVNGTVKAYAFSEYPVRQIYELDMQKRVIKGVVGVLPYQTLDAASDAEAGTVQYINIDHTSTSQECDVFNKGHAEVVTKPHTSNYTYTLPNGQSNKTGIFDNLDPGYYSVTIRSDGAESPNAAIITVPDYTIGNPVITVTQTNPICSRNGSIKLDAGGANATSSIKYNNQVYSFDHTFTELSTGNYHFTILNKNGCIIDEKNYTLVQDNCPPIPDLDKQILQECDAYNQAGVTVTAPPHTDNYTYTLNGLTNTTGVFHHLNPGNYTITVTSDGVVGATNLNVTVPDYSVNNPAITFTKTNPLCDAKGSIKLDAGLANATYSIRYNGQAFNFDHTFTGLTAGSYHFTILNQTGCIAGEKDYTLQQDICPPITINNVQIQPECNVYKQASVKVITQQHPDTYTYTLNNVSNNTGVFDFLTPGTYTLIINSSGGDHKEQQVTVPDFTIGNPTITSTKTNPLCDAKGSIKLDAGLANATYSIRYNGQVFSFDHTFTGLTAGSYHFTILNQNGCIADEKDYALQQDVCPPIIINNVQTQAECSAYGQASVTVTTQQHPDTYTYTLNNVNNSTGVFNFLAPGSYILIINSSGGDHKEQQVTVPDFTLDKPNLIYKVKAAVCTLLGEITFSINGDGKGATKVKHDNDVFLIGQTIKGLTPGPNHFTIFNQQGCILDEIDVNITQDDCEPVVFPNAFSPNGDGVNDVFRPNQESNPLNFKLLIYNRWGNQLFQSQSIYQGWDGTYKGGRLPVGVYYWIAIYKMPDGKNSRQSGSVTLIR
ncbi:gliding motility-associated C-terminal domain-containing protein [Mucilaginibacter sp. FT3.2]|uniref:gliding motility-associated C-terminal domain-containing protein n=1 Tax=Mucilaginibacter sp. FT3.2 TaxID=2723090 RepID=UPI00160BA882|nr:gliding motility-associated C-terminal domain-containing protein [Mucilaginibacter sp. FT3.2]MBB6231232.1 gliding motility-associated-like protein [Mucilaginibacter sp. FT3.2]